jgi:hypothetical protein
MGARWDIAAVVTEHFGRALATIVAPAPIHADAELLEEKRPRRADSDDEPGQGNQGHKDEQGNRGGDDIECSLCDAMPSWHVRVGAHSSGPNDVRDRVLVQLIERGPGDVHFVNL